MNKIKLIACGVSKQVGKDTFCQLLQEINPKIRRFSLADSLRELTRGISLEFFDKAPDQLDLREKELFRPVLIEVGRLARTLDVDFWCKKVYEKTSDLDFYDRDAIYCLTDMRYLNEYYYFKKLYGDSMLLVNITRDGAPEPTEEEKIHGPEVAKMADVNLKWHSDETLVSLRPIVKEFYDTYLA